METKFIDEVEKVTDDEAFKMVKKLALNEGLLVGSSSGAAFQATLKQAYKIKRGNIVTIFADRADRYLSKKIFKF
jgi:cysteine synthase